MGNSNCGCNKTRKVGGSRVKSKKGGMGCKSDPKHKHNKTRHSKDKNGGMGCANHNESKKTRHSKDKNGGCTTCGCEAPLTGGYKYNRGASIASKVRFNKRVSKKVKSKSKRKTINKKKHTKKGKKKGKKKSRSTRK